MEASHEKTTDIGRCVKEQKLWLLQYYAVSLSMFRISLSRSLSLCVATGSAVNFRSRTDSEGRATIITFLFGSQECLESNISYVENNQC